MSFDRKFRRRLVDLATPLYPLVPWFIGIIVIASCFLHQSRGNGWDFFAYYKAAVRWLQGGEIYVRESHYAFKYGALTCLFFVPFAWMPCEVARWVFAVCHCGVAIFLPWAVWRLVISERQSGGFVPPGSLAGFLVLGFLAGFRFVDAEFRASNVGLFIAAGFALAAWLGTRARAAWCVPWVLGLAAVVKVHTLLVFAALRLRDRRTLGWMVFALVGLFCIPHPRSWWEWWCQMTAPEVAMRLSPDRHNVQGFVLFAARFLGWDPERMQSAALALPFGLWAAIRLPRFSLEQLSLRPATFLLTVYCWALLAWMASPLAWQHTYSLLWVMFPLSWSLAETSQRRWILATALFLGLTPRDIVGKSAFLWLEGNQSVFLAVLIFWVVTVRVLQRRAGV